jgi:hypothetical protein
MMCVRIILFDKKKTDEILSNNEEENPAKRFKQDSSE